METSETSIREFTPEYLTVDGLFGKVCAKCHKKSLNVTKCGNDGNFYCLTKCITEKITENTAIYCVQCSQPTGDFYIQNMKAYCEQCSGGEGDVLCDGCHKTFKLRLHIYKYYTNDANDRETFGAKEFGLCNQCFRCYDNIRGCMANF